MQSIPPLHGSIRPDVFRGVVFGVEGMREARPAIVRLVRDIGGTVVDIPTALKPLYHVGGVVTSNFLILMLERVRRWYERMGIPWRTARRMMQPILLKTWDNAARHGPGRSLTGPMVRGDRGTLEAHRAALRHADPEFLPLYNELIVMANELISKNRGYSGKKRSTRKA
jgi:predicted short-subunit dehydrogenase-like oxidoreductase (DUF2520 family)